MVSAVLFTLSLALCIVVFYVILKEDKKNNEGAGGVRPEHNEGNENHNHNTPDDNDHDGMGLAY